MRTVALVALMAFALCSEAATTITLTNLSRLPRTNALYGTNYFVIVQRINDSNTTVLVQVASAVTNISSRPIGFDFTNGITVGETTLTDPLGHVLNVDGSISPTADNEFQFGTEPFRWSDGWFWNVHGVAVTIDSVTVNQPVWINAAGNLTNAATARFATAATKNIDRATSDCWEQTNRLAAAATFNITNISAGDELNLTVPGEVSGGTARDITLTWPAGWFASYHINTVTNGLTTLTVAAGETVELNIKCGILQGTNTARIVYGRYPR